MTQSFTRYLFLVLALFSTLVCTNAQSFYQLQYKMPGGKDTTTYSAFFARYDNGTAFMRVSYIIAGTNTIAKAQMNLLEEYALLADGTADTTKIIYRPFDLMMLTATKTKITPLAFCFGTTTENDYTPLGAVDMTDKMAASPSPFLSASFISSKDLTKSLVLNYFTEKDDFYQNLFGARSRGGALSTEEKKMKIYLMIVASTYDSSIGVSTNLDAQKVLQTFTDLADFMGISKNLVVDTILGDRYNRRSVDSILKKRNPAPADIIVFYYSGHGFSQKEKPKNNFPFIDLRDPRIRPRAKPADQAMNIEDIYTAICKKGARINLVISDCCNDEVPVKKVAGPIPPKTKSSGVKWNWDNVRSLFLSKEPVSLLETAATKGELASGTDRFGGFFTHYFLASLTTYLGADKSNPKWPQVALSAQMATTLKAGSMKLQQNPKVLTQRAF